MKRIRNYTMRTTLIKKNLMNVQGKRIKTEGMRLDVMEHRKVGKGGKEHSKEL